MPEDIDFGKLFDGLDQIPGLIENSKKQDLRDKANADKFKEIKEDVSNMKTEISSLKSELASFKTVLTDAKAAFQKPVTIQDKNIHITKDDIRITQNTPEWIRTMGSEYQEIKNKELSRKQRNIVTIGGPRFSTFLAIFFFVVIMIGVALFLWADSQSKNSVEAYAERAYNAAIANDYSNPGDYYNLIREQWNNGDIEDAKNSVEHWEQAVKNRDYFKNILSPLYDNQRIIIVSYSVKNNEAVVWWRLYDDDKDMVSHIQKNGKVTVADAKKLKIGSIEDAHKYSKSKFWTTIKEGE